MSQKKRKTETTERALTTTGSRTMIGSKPLDGTKPTTGLKATNCLKTTAQKRYRSKIIRKTATMVQPLMMSGSRRLAQKWVLTRICKTRKIRKAQTMKQPLMMNPPQRTMRMELHFDEDTPNEPATQKSRSNINLAGRKFTDDGMYKQQGLAQADTCPRISPRILEHSKRLREDYSTAPVSEPDQKKQKKLPAVGEGIFLWRP